MEKEISKASLARKKKRESPQMQAFKEKILAFLEETDASESIKYHIAQDLSKMTNMPFYGTAKIGIKNKTSSDFVVKEYCKLFILYYQRHRDMEFIEEMFKWLSRQQNQHLRKLSKIPPSQKNKKRQLATLGKTGIFEHPVPVNYSKRILVDYIRHANLQELEQYIDFIYNNTYQVFLETTWNKCVSDRFNDSMPSGWCWKDAANNNVFQRYIDCGIPPSQYLLNYK